jgi:hypothetical protein
LLATQRVAARLASAADEMQPSQSLRLQKRLASFNQMLFKLHTTLVTEPHGAQSPLVLSQFRDLMTNFRGALG